jgi:NADH:ubiquinone oxidoreductase subunit C
LHNRRLPFVPSHRQATASRFTGIRFGDHTREDEPSTPANPTNAPLSILSRILLNLPFQLLKYILESSRLGNVSGWATAALRQNVMYAVIEEREKRRIKVLTSTANNDTTRQTQEREWNAVGWKEFVSVPKAGTDKSVLDREWVGYQIQNGN